MHCAAQSSCGSPPGPFACAPPPSDPAADSPAVPRPPEPPAWRSCPPSCDRNRTPPGMVSPPATQRTYATTPSPLPAPNPPPPPPPSSPPADNFASLFALARRFARSFSSPAIRSALSERSKYFFPSIQVCRQTVPESSGGLDQIGEQAVGAGGQIQEQGLARL